MREGALEEKAHALAEFLLEIHFRACSCWLCGVRRFEVRFELRLPRVADVSGVVGLRCGFDFSLSVGREVDVVDVVGRR